MTSNDIQGYFSFEPFYNYIATGFLKDGMTIVEIGTYKGKSATYLAQRIKDKKLSIKFYTVDHFSGSAEQNLKENRFWYVSQLQNTSSYLYDTFTNNISQCGLTEYITPIIGYSVEVAHTFPDESFDFIFLDGSHDYENVLKDIEAWTPKLKGNSSIIGGDDYDKFWPGVMKAVDKKFGDQVRVHKPAWYYIKK